MSLLPPTISSLLVSFFPVSSSRQRPDHGHPHHAPRPGARAGRREPPPGAKAAASRRAQGQGPAAASRPEEQRPSRAAAPRGKGRRAQEHRLPRAAPRRSGSGGQGAPPGPSPSSRLLPPGLQPGSTRRPGRKGAPRRCHGCWPATLTPAAGARPRGGTRLLFSKVCRDSIAF